MSSRRRWRWQILLAALAFSALLTAGLCELVLRVLGVSYPVFWTVDRDLGLVLRPDTSGWFGDEGGAFVSTNEHGMRDVARTRAKPPGTYRIAVLGDSFIEALQVAREDTLTALLERKLSTPTRPVEVLNFGCSGYGTAQELLTLSLRVRHFAPDLVLVGVLTGNDLTDNERSLDAELRRPYFVWRGDDLELDNGFRDAPYFRTRANPLLDALAVYCRTFQVANAMRRHGATALRSKEARLPPPVFAAQASAPPATVASRQPGLDDGIYLEPTDELWKRMWRTMEALLERMRDESARQQSRFGVLIISNGVDVNPDPNTRDGYARSMNARDLSYPSTRVETFCRRKSIPVLNLVDPLRAYADRTGAYLHGFAGRGTIGAGHWNEKGHAQAAELAAPWIAKTFAP